MKKILIVLAILGLSAACATVATSGEKLSPAMAQFLERVQARAGTVHIDVYKPGTIIEVLEGPEDYIVVVERDRSKIPNESDDNIPVNPYFKNKYTSNN